MHPNVSVVTSLDLMEREEGVQQSVGVTASRSVEAHGITWFLGLEVGCGIDTKNISFPVNP